MRVLTHPFTQALTQEDLLTYPDSIAHFARKLDGSTQWLLTHARTLTHKDSLAQPITRVAGLRVSFLMLPSVAVAVLLFVCCPPVEGEKIRVCRGCRRRRCCCWPRRFFQHKLSLTRSHTHSPPQHSHCVPLRTHSLALIILLNFNTIQPLLSTSNHIITTQYCAFYSRIKEAVERSSIHHYF